MTRLQAGPQAGPREPARTRVRVDRTGLGKLLGVSVVTQGPAIGHGVTLTRTLVEQVAERLNGVPGRWTHGWASEDGLGRHLGTWENARLEAISLGDAVGKVDRRVVADFAFSATGHKIKPDGLDVSAPVYLMDRAEEDPRTLGVSIVAHLRETNEDGSFADEDLEGLDDDSDGNSFVALDLRDPRPLLRADFVADPAANPSGLLALHAGTGAPGALTEEAEREVRRMVHHLGAAEARNRALALLNRLLPESQPALTTPAKEGDVKELEEARAEVARLKAEVETRDVRLATLAADVDALRRADAERKAAEAAAYVAALRADGIKHNSPVPEPDLALVAARLAAGDDEAAKALGKAFRERSEALGSGPFKRALSAPAAASKAEEYQAAANRQVAEARARSEQNKAQTAGRTT